MAIYLMNWKMASILIGGFLSAVLALMALKCRKDRRREMTVALLSAALMIADMASPVFGVYYMVMSTPAVAYVVTVALRERAGALLLGLLPFMVMMAVPSYHPAIICLFILLLLAYRLSTAADRPAWRIDRWLRWWPGRPRKEAPASVRAA